VIRTFKDRTPAVDPSAYIDESAQVIGDVVIGAESSVWMNVVIRGDVNRIRIGARSNIQDLTMVHVMRDTHPTTIGDEVTVGHSAVIHGCTIEDRVLVGMAAVLLNGVRVGHDSIVAAGSLLPEGMEVPPRSLVMGRPARVKRTLSDEEVATVSPSAGRVGDAPARTIAVRRSGTPANRLDIVRTAASAFQVYEHETRARDARLPSRRRPTASVRDWRDRRRV
jgi:carbonic anhydrase/acetyltransferase-like protein (isoleucine patch superfamily)